ncbi:MAG: murein biosynthesis integral membrane protein MurJ [Planctomycetota bacterium]|nr:murein biosynthesis integral membrane protein MurJ [Planctomycetota bacterium]
MEARGAQDRPEQKAAEKDEGSDSGHHQFMGAARVVAGVTLVSRFGGLARDAVCSRIFGAGPVWSSFALAFVIPNLFRRLFGEGALSAAFIPEYARLLREDPEQARRFASATLAVVTLGLAGLTLVGEAVLWGLLAWTALGESGGLTLRLAMVMLPFMPLVCLTALLGGMLQTHGRFAETAAAPIVLNALMIAAAVAWGWLMRASLEATAFAVAVAVVSAGAVQVAWSLAALRGRAGWTREMGGAGASLGRLARRMGPAMLGLGALQINTFLDGIIAGWPVLFGPTIGLPGLGETTYPLDESSNAVLFFTQRLYQFPLGVFGIALATAVFPALAHAAGSSDRFAATLRRGLRLSLFIGLPASAGLIAVRSDLAAVVLGGGRFSTEDSARVATVLLGYAPAIWAYAASHVYTRAFYAQGDTTTPMRISLVVVAADLCLNVILIWPLREAGLAWSTSICATGQCIALAVLARRRFNDTGGHPALRASVWRMLALTVGMGAVLLGAGWALERTALAGSGDAPLSWAGHLVRLALLVAAGVGLYLGGARLLRMKELGWLVERDVERGMDSPR